ncbi:MAG: hypothetical protein HW406_1969 [Candidatus Brocadiaceae bacterium]|nr:hypothetical protein [Candidatus Brocadiaceae bacterium]
MSIALLAVGIIVFLCGCSILSVAKSSIHEIEAFILFLIATVLFTGAAIVSSLKSPVKQNRPKELDNIKPMEKLY